MATSSMRSGTPKVIEQRLSSDSQSVTARESILPTECAFDLRNPAIYSCRHRIADFVEMAELAFLEYFHQIEVRHNAFRQNRLRLHRRQLRDLLNPFDMEETSFRATFRLSREAARFVIDSLANGIPEARIISGIPNHLKILATLNFYASGSYQRRVGDSFMATMSQSSVSRCVVGVTRAINNILFPQWIVFPITQAEKNATKQRFMEANNFPGVVGCVDGTQVAIVAPTYAQRAELYVNRKGYHSINVQLVCNYDLQITSLNARHPGGHHDQFIWRSSQLRAGLLARHRNGGLTNEWILGDSGYTAEPWLLLPMTNQPDGSPGARYTHAQCQTRNCVERCIGVLKGRWRCLRKERGLHYSPQQAGLIINACVIMHNIALHYRLPAPPLFLDEIDAVQPIAPRVPPVAVAVHDNLYQQGIAIRNRLIAARFTN